MLYQIRKTIAHMISSHITLLSLRKRRTVSVKGHIATPLENLSTNKLFTLNAKSHTIINVWKNVVINDNLTIFMSLVIYANASAISFLPIDLTYHKYLNNNKKKTKLHKSNIYYCIN